jgi:hypothetical protein
VIRDFLAANDRNRVVTDDRQYHNL